MTDLAPRRLPGEATEDGWPEFYTLREACAAVGQIDRTLRRAIHSGALRAVTPQNRDPRHLGRQRYLIRRADLQAWYFGETRPGQFTTPGGFVAKGTDGAPPDSGSPLS